MGESKLKVMKSQDMLLSCAGVQTAGGRVQVRWESESAATPIGQLAYFVEFLTLTGLWSRWQNRFPLSYASPNAPTKRSSPADRTPRWPGTGSVVTYLQLAENVWDPEKRRSQASIVWNCGRAGDTEVVERLRKLAIPIRDDAANYVHAACTRKR